ncbi:MAG TPA: OsmC family protein [Gaiellaceae bacterium]
MEDGLLIDPTGAPADWSAPPTVGNVRVESRPDGTLEARTRDVTLTVGRSGGGLQSVELFLAALGSCMVGTMLTYARTSGVALDGVRLELEPVLAESRGRVAEVRLWLRVDGEIEPRRVAALRRAAEQCKLHATLEQPVVLSLEVEHGPVV